MTDRYAHFGVFTVDTVEFGIWKNGEKCESKPLTPLTIRILLRLLEKQGEIVRACDLRDLLTHQYSEGLIESSLTKYISRLRRYTGEEMRLHVQTVSKTRNSEQIGGYRFVGTVEFSTTRGCPKSADVTTRTGGGSSLKGTDKIAKPVRTPAGEMHRADLFCYPGGHVDAISLFGRAGQYVASERLFVTYEHESYSTPLELQEAARDRIDELKRDAKLRNRDFFNGPNVRLVWWNHNQYPPAELHTLELVFKRAGWFDLEGTNNLVRAKKLQGILYGAYVNLEQIKHVEVQVQLFLADERNIDLRTADQEPC